MARAKTSDWMTRIEQHPLALSTLAALIAVGAGIGMAIAAGVGEVVDRVEQIAPQWLAVAVGARLVGYVGYAIAHHRVMGASEKTELEAETAARVAAFGAGATSLRGGFSIDMRALRGSGASVAQARAHVTALAFLELAVLSLAGWVCALLLLDDPNVKGVAVWPWVLGVPAGVVLAVFVLMGLRARVRERRAGERVRSLVRGTEILAQQARRPLGALAAISGMALYWAAEAGALWASLRAFGVTCAPTVAILGCATAYVLTPRGLPLAGAGISEALLPVSLMWLGVPLAAAVPAALAAELVRLAVSVPLAALSREEVHRLVSRGRRAQRAGKRRASAAARGS